MIALEILLLFTPAVIYALWNGRNGLKHPNPSQVKTVALIMLVCVSVVRFIQICRHGAPFVMTPETILWWYLKPFLVAVTGYGLFFNPLMNAVLTIRKDIEHGGRWSKTEIKNFIIYCLDHLSPTAVPDKYFIKFKIGWKTRLIGYVALFVGSILWFVL